MADALLNQGRRKKISPPRLCIALSRVYTGGGLSALMTFLLIHLLSGLIASPLSGRLQSTELCGPGTYQAEPDTTDDIRNQFRRSAIMQVSRDSVVLMLRRESVVRDSTSLLSARIEVVGSGGAVTAYAFDGRWWGVKTAGGIYGYLPERSLSGDYEEISRLQTSQSSASPPSTDHESVRVSSRRLQTCRSFGSAASAQAAFDSDPEGLAHLD